jgi:Txe/YoeB family toxin of toxin-antitoxin system
VKWKVVLSKKAVKDAQKLKQAGLKHQAQTLLLLLAENPFQIPPAYEKLVGNLTGYYSRRINIQHRLIYAVHNDEKVVHVLRMRTHYK